MCLNVVLRVYVIHRFIKQINHLSFPSSSLWFINFECVTCRKDLPNAHRIQICPSTMCTRKEKKLYSHLCISKVSFCNIDWISNGLAIYSISVWWIEEWVKLLGVNYWTKTACLITVKKLHSGFRLKNIISRMFWEHDRIKPTNSSSFVCLFDFTFLL